MKAVVVGQTYFFQLSSAVVSSVEGCRYLTCLAVSVGHGGVF